MEPRPTPASRLAERDRQRELRAERLARLRPPAGAEAALEEFLRALIGPASPAAPAPAPAPGAILPFPRPEREDAPADFDRLPGAGPGLVWALQRAGLRSLADLAALDPDELAARLGPIGRLVPAAAWIAAARAATGARPDAGTDG